MYIVETINSIPMNELHRRIRDDLFLETLILRIRGESIKFASVKKNKKNVKAKQLIFEVVTGKG